ncbi:hypothetical protein Tco_0812161, partial [Tanacetum coccineum]
MLVLTREPVFGVFVYFGVMRKSCDVAPHLHDGTSTTAQLYPELLGPAPALMTPGYISSGLMQNSVSPTPYVPPSKKDYEILAVDPVGSPSSTTIDQDEQSTSTSPSNQEIQSQVTHQENVIGDPSRPVPQFTPDHSSSGPVLHEMTSDQIRSDLTPNQQETSVDNISSDLVSNKQKASDYDISGPVPPRKNVVSLADKTDSSQKEIEFLFN